MANVTEPIGPPAAAAGRRRPAPGAALPAGLALAWAAALAAAAGPDLGRWLAGGMPGALALSLAAAAICLVPGLAMLRWLWREEPLPWPERLVAAGGLGLGAPALLLMAAHLLHLPWSRWATAGYLAASLAALLAPRRGPAPPPKLRPAPGLPALLVAGLTAAALLARLYSARDMLVGANADSYHHTMIAELLVERGGLFTSWQPYAPLTTFTYHYGFHALVAFTAWLTGAAVPGLLPVVGQAVLAATVPAAYALARQAGGSQAAGVWAALLAGFVNTQPAFYAFWGRYPFAAGHLLLVAALLCWGRALEAPRAPAGPMALAALACAALAHLHYQITMLAALFVGAYVAALLLRAPSWRAAGQVLLRSALIGAAALAIAAPWLLNTVAGNLDRNVSFNSDRQSGEAFAGVPLPPLVPFYLKGALAALAAAGLALALRERSWRMGLAAAWAALCLLAALPYLVGLPGTGMFEPSVAPLSLYLPAAALGGYALARALPLRLPEGPWAGDRLAAALGAGGAAAVVLASAWGLAWQRDVVPPYARMVTPADMRAFAWVGEHTAPDARFLVSSSPLYGGLMLVGTDGGWWLPLLAGRQTTVPPLTYGSELAEDPGFAQRTDALAAQLRRAPLADGRPRTIDLTRDSARAALRAAGVRYVYIGAQPLTGPQTFGAVDRIDPAPLLSSPDFRQVYSDGGVMIFELAGG